MASQHAITPPSATTSDVRLDRAFRLVANQEVRVLSLDVFDTLLWRRVPNPVDAFELLGGRLRELGLLPEHVEPRVFRQMRIAGEGQARRVRAAAGGGSEISLDQVYAALAVSGMLGGEPHIAKFVDAEVELERELLVPDLDVLALLQAARESGMAPIGVSDTYFSERHLVRLLGNRGVRLDRVFVSSAFGVGKADGLWSIVVDALGAAPAEVLHVGDNDDADQRAPRELGIRTVLFERRDAQLAELLKREARHLDTRAVRQHGDFGLTALRSKVLYRRGGADLPKELQTFWRFGAAALGPTFTGFAEWVQELAVGIGTGKVHCLMREGALLARLINNAGDYLAAPVQAEPLWLSRQVLARAAIRQPSPEELAHLLARQSPPTVRDLCRALDLDVARLGGLAHHADSRMDDSSLRTEVFGTLSRDPELRTHIVAVGEQARARVLRYVEQVRSPGDGPLVLVDVGWQATIQSLLNAVLRVSGVSLRTIGLYLLTHAGAIERQLAGTEAHGYLGQSGEPHEVTAAIARSPEVLEQVCMPDHSSQRDLSPELTPVLEPDAQQSLLQVAERRAAQQGIGAFQREWARYRIAVPDALPSLATGARPLLRAQLVRAVTAPTTEEASVFGAWLHDENYGSNASHPMVNREAVRALRHLDPKGLVEMPMQDVYWPFGLAAAHDEYLARAAELVATGILPWEAFGSQLETGDINVYYDNGWGFADERRLTTPGRRNRFGLTFARTRVNAEEVRAVRLEPAQAPCLVRVDWLVLRAWQRDRTEQVTRNLETPGELAQLPLQQCYWLAPKLLQVAGDKPHLFLDLDRLVGRGVYDMELLCALAIVPTLPPEPFEGEFDRWRLAARKRVRRLELRASLPITPAYRSARSLLRRARSNLHARQ